MKTSQLKMIIREVVREEIRLGLQEIIGDFKKPKKQVKEISQPKSKRKVVDKKDYTSNPIINNILNETAQSEEWQTMGDGTYDSSKIGDVMYKSYGVMMSNNPNTPVTVDGKQPDFLKKDYRTLMKAVDKKQGK